MFGFVSVIKYNRLLLDRNRLLEENFKLSRKNDRETTKLVKEAWESYKIAADKADELALELEKYKKMYMDEIQKRFELLMLLNEYEKNEERKLK